MCDPGDTGTLGKQVNEWLDSELSPCLPAWALDEEAAVFQTVALCKPFLSGGIIVTPVLAKEKQHHQCRTTWAVPGDQHWVRFNVSRRLWSQHWSLLEKLEGRTWGVRATAAPWASCCACWVAFDITLPTSNLSVSLYITLCLFPSLPLPSTLWPAFFLPPPFPSLKKNFF